MAFKKYDFDNPETLLWPCKIHGLLKIDQLIISYSCHDKLGKKYKVASCRECRRKKDRDNYQKNKKPIFSAPLKEPTILEEVEKTLKSIKGLIIERRKELKDYVIQEGSPPQNHKILCKNCGWVSGKNLGFKVKKHISNGKDYLDFWCKPCRSSRQSEQSKAKRLLRPKSPRKPRHRKYYHSSDIGNIWECKIHGGRTFDQLSFTAKDEIGYRYPKCRECSDNGRHRRAALKPGLRKSRKIYLSSDQGILWSCKIHGGLTFPDLKFSKKLAEGKYTDAKCRKCDNEKWVKANNRRKLKNDKDKRS